MKKKYLVLSVLASLAFSSTHSFALTTLREIRNGDGEQIRLQFDRSIRSDQVKVEYFRNIVQLSIKNTSVYPAKIKTMKGKALKKVFAYQYTPNLIRCRLTVEGDATRFKGRVKISSKGKQIRVALEDPMASSSDRLKMTKAKTVSARSVESAASKEKEDLKGKTASYTVTEKNLLNRVLNKKPGQEAEALTSGQPLPNPFKSFWWLTVVLAFFGFIAFVFKKIRDGSLKTGKKLGLKSITHRLARKGLLARKDEMIDVVGTRYLGPKKNITIVKVGGRLLVLGITDENINLITQMEGGEDVNEEAIDEVLTKSMSDGPRKSVNLNQQNPIGAPPVESPPGPKFNDVLKRESVRSRIRQRVEGMKEL